jgi:hypothetical protein
MWNKLREEIDIDLNEYNQSILFYSILNSTVVVPS